MFCWNAEIEYTWRKINILNLEIFAIFSNLLLILQISLGDLPSEGRFSLGKVK